MTKVEPLIYFGAPNKFQVDGAPHQLTVKNNIHENLPDGVEFLKIYRSSQPGTDMITGTRFSG